MQIISPFNSFTLWIRLLVIRLCGILLDCFPIWVSLCCHLSSVLASITIGISYYHPHLERFSIWRRSFHYNFCHLNRSLASLSFGIS